MKDKKIVVVASNSAHTLKFLSFIEKEFKEILVISSNKIENYNENVMILKGNPLKKVLQFNRAIKNFNPDFIHFQNLSLDKIIYSFFVKNYKSIITTWGSDILIFPEKKFINKLLVKIALKNFWRISTNDALAMQIKLQQLTLKKIYPIHFGINKYIKFTEFERKENIIYSPRSHRDLYNIENVIYSFAEFLKINRNWKLILSGREDKINTPKYKQLCKELNISNKVEFKGFISGKENAEYFAKAKIVVSIPSSDAKSVTIMEAISSNCICFVSDLPSNREMIVNGINGLIVDKDKIIDFENYKNIDTDLMTRFNKIVLQNYLYENAKNKFLDLYKER